MSSIAIALLFLGLTGEAFAQFYKVYGWSTPKQGEVELVYWTSYIVSSDLSHQFFDKTVNRDNLWAHSFEVEYGITDRFAAAAYVDFEDSADASDKVTFRSIISVELKLSAEEIKASLNHIFII